MQLILYSKPGCHLCEGLQDKLEQVSSLPLKLETRDITTQDEWFQRYQYEIPVLYWVPLPSDFPESSPKGVEASPAIAPVSEDAWVRLPRLSPRSTVQQVEQMLQKVYTNYRPK